MSYKIKVKLTKNSRLKRLDFNNIPFGKTFSDHMFTVDYADGAWKNPQIVPFGYMALHPANLAIHYGQSLFEGMKASKMLDGTPALFRTNMHVERLNASARRLCMPEVPAELFKEALEMLVDIDRDWIPPMEGSTLYIRPYMYATDEFLGVRPSEDYKFAIITGPVGPYYSKPVTLWAETEYIRAAHGGTGEAKSSGNYAGALLPTKLANQRGFDQILWLDAVEHKYVQEAGTMNLMFVIDGKVITAPTDGTILRGITRNTMLILLKDNGYAVEERPLSMDEIVAAYHAGTLQEVFGCGTAAVVSHVASVTHGDLTINLPPVENRKIGAWLKNQIDKLRTGAIADKYGWVEPIGVGELV
ncbi:MAG: branched-chain amino acid aminotransferase [Saprospiraceae bacterium]|nr:branched-chain amino acid aminotransferase [Saprospiraceae bacterium]